MPCYTVRRVGFDIKAADADLLAEALTAVGWTRGAHGVDILAVAKYIISQGEIRVSESQGDKVNQVRRRYAELVVEKTAKRYGWKVQRQGTKLLVRR